MDSPIASLRLAPPRRTLISSSVGVVHSRFEDWSGPWGAYAAVVAATAWQWVDPARRYELAAAALRPAATSPPGAPRTSSPSAGTRSSTRSRKVYDAIGEGLPAGAPRPEPGQLPDHSEEIEASGLFDVVAVEHFDWTVDYDADSYLRLLSTFSGHIAMPPDRRERLYAEIRRRLSEGPNGRLRRGWGAVLHVARRCDHPRPQSQ